MELHISWYEVTFVINKQEKPKIQSIMAVSEKHQSTVLEILASDDNLMQDLQRMHSLNEKESILFPGTAR